MLVIIGVVIGYLALSVLAGALFACWKNRREQKSNIAYANRSLKELCDDALIWPQYWHDYNTFRLCMSEDEARKIIVQRYLIERGLIGYRKEEIEL